MANPDLILIPFAQDGDKNTIPVELSIGDPVYRASLKVGFPPNTRIPKDIGGEPPDGLDFNGILNVLSQAIVFMQRGNGYRFDSNLAPYPIGALIRSNDDLTTFQNTEPLNSNNPNSNMSGWRVYNGSGFIVDNLTTDDGNKTLSAKQGKALQDNKLGKTENAVSATKLFTTRTIALTGAVVGNAIFDGTTNISISTTAGTGTIQAYANYNGVTNAMRKSSGIESIANQGGGCYLITLSKAATDANYVIQATCSHTRGDAGSVNIDPAFNPTATQFRLKCTYGGDNTAGSFSPEFLSVAVIY